MPDALRASSVWILWRGNTFYTCVRKPVCTAPSMIRSIVSCAIKEIHFVDSTTPHSLGKPYVSAWVEYI